MSTIVIGALASHTTLMNTKWAEVDHLQRAHEFRNALASARAAIAASGAEVAVIVGPNHFRGMWLDLMPTFTIGVGNVSGVGEHGTPKGPLPTDPELAHALLSSASDAGFDLAMSARLEVDHGITHAVQWVLPEGMPGAGGYREHDILVITKDGNRNLTAFPYGPEHNIIKA